jgi:hypothetical protein
MAWQKLAMKFHDALAGQALQAVRERHQALAVATVFTINEAQRTQLQSRLAQP